MSGPDRRRVRAALAWLAALAAAVLVGLAVPATSSAFTAAITNSRDTAASKDVFTCGDLQAAPARRKAAFFEYSFREDAGATTAKDSGGRENTGTYEGSNAKDTASPRACPADSGAPYALDGSTSRVTTSTYFDPIRTDFSIEVWFKTTATSEKIMGFEGTQTGRSDNYDKQFYIDDRGYLHYAIYDGNTRTTDSPDPVNDGLWHHAVATTSADGSLLYLDGRLVAKTPDKTTAEGFGGWWRIGEGRLDSWPGAPSYSWFTGSLSFAAAYGIVLTPEEIASEYGIGQPGTPAATATPAPTDSTATATPVPAPSRGRATLAPVTQDTSSTNSSQ